MSKTVIPWGHPSAVKKWSAHLAAEVLSDNFFKKFSSKKDNLIIQEKTELEGDEGDRVSFDLSVQLRGKPTTGDDTLEGNEENLRFFSDEVIIDQARKSVSAGGRMSRKRTLHDLRTVAKDRLKEYWSEYLDELDFMTLSGARGHNEDFIEDLEFAGHGENELLAPDSSHHVFGGAATSKATLTAADTMSTALIERLATKAKMLRSLNVKNANMKGVKINSKDHYVLLMSPWDEHNLRRETGSAGWVEIQKAAATAQGKSNPIFTGGLGMISDIVLHSHNKVVRFTDAGVGEDVSMARSLFMGRQAAVKAWGTPKGRRFTWVEEKKDFENNPAIAAGTIIGVKKTRFQNRDYGVIAVDCAAADPEAA